MVRFSNCLTLNDIAWQIGCMVQRSPLDEKQSAVLRWVNEGHPDGPLATPGNKNRAQGLANRGLVSIRRGNRGWRATLTEEGRHYLETGRYLPRPTSDPRPPAQPQRGRSKDPSAAAIPAAREPKKKQAPEPSLDKDPRYLIPPKARNELRLRKQTMYRKDTSMRYKVRVTRVQVAERYVTAPDREAAADKARTEFERPYGYFGTWDTVASGLDVIEEQRVETIAPVDLSREGPMLMPLKQAADAFGVSYSMLATLTGNGDIEQVRMGSRRYVKRDSLLRYVDAHTY